MRVARPCGTWNVNCCPELPNAEYPAMMLCPYCAEEINDKAIVCKHCQSNLLAVRPFLDRMGELERKVDEVAGALDQRLAALESVSRRGAAAKEGLIAHLLSAAEEPKSWPAFIRDQLTLFVGPLLLLLLAHWVIIVLYDLSPWLLRIAAISIPLPCGVFSWLRGNRRLVFSLIFAFSLAVAAVLGMSALTGMIDETPVLPRDTREWREMFEFAASIGFSFLSGLLIGRWMLSYRSKEIRPSAAVASLARLLGGGPTASPADLNQAIKKANELVNMLTTLASTLAAVVTSLHSMAGSG